MPVEQPEAAQTLTNAQAALATAQANAHAAQATAQANAQILATFRQALYMAIDNAQQNREIGLLQAYTLRAAAGRPRRLAAMLHHVTDECQCCGSAQAQAALASTSTPSAIDLAALVAFLQAFLPMLAQLLAMLKF